MKNTSVTRREFVKATAASAFMFTILPHSAKGANERINVGCIGIGGKGSVDVAGTAAAGGNIVALCDVDMQRRVRKGGDHVKNYPKAKFYKDFRVMLEKEKGIDAVTVSTPDHTHALASIMAMKMGKHCFCQKPLTHSIYEARMVSKVAAETGVATQMGNQAHAGDPLRREVELVRAGVVGKVHEVHVWTNRPIWPQGIKARPTPGDPMPNDIDWDLWLGPAPYRPFHRDYAPFKWRGWWDWGTGALGDMGCHIMDMPYWALRLKQPISVEAVQEGNTAESGPTSATITYQFPAREGQPPVKFVWYDGQHRPPKDVTGDVAIESKPGSGRFNFDGMLIGDKGKFFFQRSKTNWITRPEPLIKEYDALEPFIPRVQGGSNAVYKEWLDACTGAPKARSNFGHAGRFTEVVLLGNLAARVGKKIEWDGANMKAKNAPEAEQYIRRQYRHGWDIADYI